MGDPEDREESWEMLSSGHGAAFIFMSSLDKTCIRSSQRGWSTLQQVLEIGLSGLQKMGELGVEGEGWGCIYYETVKNETKDIQQQRKWKQCF